MNATLIEVDELTSKVLDCYEDDAREQTLQELKAQYGESAVTEVLEEIDTLKADGTFFGTIDYNTVKNNNDGAIKALCLHVSHDCDLRCKYCFAGTGAFGGGRSIMSYEVGRKAFDYLIAHSANRKNLEVDFFGGEPLMNMDVVKRLVTYGRELEKKHEGHHYE